MFCIACGKKISVKDKFCMHCGVSCMDKPSEPVVRWDIPNGKVKAFTPRKKKVKAFKPKAELVSIECPGCEAQMKVPKLNELQEVTCGECGLSGEIEI